jgi:hypothetical protein
MNIEAVLQKILENQERILERFDELEEGLSDIRESVSNLSLPGSDYNVYTADTE